MLEYAVRPFTSPNAQGKIIIPSTPAATNQRATITWGSKSTNVPQAQQTGDFNVICCVEHLQEIEREGETVQVPVSQQQVDQGYVEVFRSKTLKLNKKQPNNGPCDSPLSQALGQEFGLDDNGDMTIDMGFAGTETLQDKCGAVWELNNNTAGV